ncbi:MAG: glycosyltransferase family 2 protein [Pseudomonadota bacterium]
MVKSRELRLVSDRLNQIEPGDILLFFCARNELQRLPFFFDYYRKIGVRHFIAVDNGSDDGTTTFLSTQPDCTLWVATGSYRSARFGMDWINALLARYAVGHWAIIVDPDEFLVFPHQNVRPLRALLDWMDAGNIRSFGALLLDMYPKGSFSASSYVSGENPLDHSPYFDPQNYQSKLDRFYSNLWMQGGPRQRIYYADRPERAPALNKIPLVKWSKQMVFRSSTHQLLPRGLNVTYSQSAIPRPCGCLLHFKFLPSLKQKAEEEQKRREHYQYGQEYIEYLKRPDALFWTDHSAQFQNWQQLEELGLMSRGDWV